MPEFVPDLQPWIKCYIITSSLTVPVSVTTEFKSKPAVRAAGYFDRAAICVSGLCLAQCLFLPVVLAASLVTLGAREIAAFHLFLLAVILPLSLAAFALGYLRHRSTRMVLPGLGGLSLLVLTAVLEPTLDPVSRVVLTSLGGVLLITGHMLNIRDRRLTACGT